jgi:hypothetical protein
MQCAARLEEALQDWEGDRMSGPWADWNSPLNDQAVLIDATEYTTMKTATEEMRRWIDDVDDEAVLLPGRPKRKKVTLCDDHAECEEDDPPHWKEFDVWEYHPHQRKPRVSGPPVIGRCSFCGLLVLIGQRTKKTYTHTIYSTKAGRLDDCPGSREPGLAIDEQRDKVVEF